MYEQYICVIKGEEEFRVVSPIYRQNIYVGVSEKLQSNQSPLDLFNVDYERFPHAKQAKIQNVTLKAGDCMYVPAYFYL